jgi:hypothetical protein
VFQGRRSEQRCAAAADEHAAGVQGREARRAAEGEDPHAAPAGVRADGQQARGQGDESGTKVRAEAPLGAWQESIDGPAGVDRVQRHLREAVEDAAAGGHPVAQLADSGDGLTKA